MTAGPGQSRGAAAAPRRRSQWAVREAGAGRDRALSRAGAEAAAAPGGSTAGRGPGPGLCGGHGLFGRPLPKAPSPPSAFPPRKQRIKGLSASPCSWERIPCRCLQRGGDEVGPRTMAIKSFRDFSRRCPDSAWRGENFFLEGFLGGLVAFSSWSGLAYVLGDKALKVMRKCKKASPFVC